MPEITENELVRIAKEIEATAPDKYGSIAQAEFGWLYTPGETLRHLEKEDRGLGGLFMLDGNVLAMKPYDVGLAVAHIHNHPHGNVHPSLSDVNVLLQSAERGELLDRALIAATSGGVVSGFYEMEFRGDQTKAAGLVKQNNDLYKRCVASRRKMFEEEPRLFGKAVWGRDILSRGDHFRMARMAMKASLVVGRARPLPGYQSNKWTFTKAA